MLDSIEKWEMLLFFFLFSRFLSSKTAINFIFACAQDNFSPSNVAISMTNALVNFPRTRNVFKSRDLEQEIKRTGARVLCALNTYLSLILNLSLYTDEKSLLREKKRSYTILSVFVLDEGFINWVLTCVFVSHPLTQPNFSLINPLINANHCEKRKKTNEKSLAMFINLFTQRIRGKNWV